MAANKTNGLAGPTRPLGSPDIPQFYLPAPSATGVYTPKLYGAARIHFADRKRKIDETRSVAFLVPLDGLLRTLDWDAAVATDATPDRLLKTGAAGPSYLPLPAGAMDLKTFTRWAKAFDRWLARTQRLDVPTPPETPPETPDEKRIGPKRGGVTVDLVAIAWDLI